MWFCNQVIMQVSHVIYRYVLSLLGFEGDYCITASDHFFGFDHSLVKPTSLIKAWKPSHDYQLAWALSPRFGIPRASLVSIHVSFQKILCWSNRIRGVQPLYFCTSCERKSAISWDPVYPRFATATETCLILQLCWMNIDLSAPGLQITKSLLAL